VLSSFITPLFITPLWNAHAVKLVPVGPEQRTTRCCRLRRTWPARRPLADLMTVWPHLRAYPGGSRRPDPI